MTQFTPKEKSPATLGIEVPRGNGVSRADVRASTAVLTYNKASYADLRVKKLPKADPGYHENILDQHRRIAQALLTQAQVEPGRKMYLSVNCPEELDGPYRKLFFETLAGVFEHFRPGYQIGSRYPGSQEKMTLVLKHARERGNWANMLQDQQIYLTAFSNGEYTGLTVMTVSPKRLMWRTKAEDEPNAMLPTLNALRDMLPEVQPGDRIGVWTNTGALNDMLAGRTRRDLSREAVTIAKAIRDYRQSRDLQFSLVSREDVNLQKLSFHLAVTALRDISEKKLLTPQQQRAEADRATEGQAAPAPVPEPSPAGVEPASA